MGDSCYKVSSKSYFRKKQHYIQYKIGTVALHFDI